MSGLGDIKLSGFQKLTLLDYPGKMAAMLFLPGCNMRCPFCHNSQVVYDLHQGADIAEAFEYLRQRRNILEGVVITGGEPSLQDIVPLITALKDEGYAVKIDTNGLRPGEIRRWLETGAVDYIAMDIKAAPYAYAAACGLKSVNMAMIHESVDIIMDSGIDYEFRTTIMRPFHKPSDFDEIGRELIPNAERFYIQAFVQRYTVPDQSLREPTDEFLKTCLASIKPHVKHAEIRGRDI